MIDKENEDSSEDYGSEEDNQILIIQEILSEELSQDEEESDDKKNYDDVCAYSYKSINLISKDSKTPLNIFIHNYVPLINSIYFRFWYIKDKLIRYLIHASKGILNFEISLQMEQERIKFGKCTLLVFPKNNLSFQIHKDIEGLDRSQKYILNNLWNAKK